MVSQNTGDNVYLTVISLLVRLLSAAYLTLSLRKRNGNVAGRNSVVRILDVVSRRILSLTGILYNGTGSIPLEAIGKSDITKLNSGSPYTIKGKVEVCLGHRLVNYKLKRNTAEVSLILNSKSSEIGSCFGHNVVAQYGNVGVSAIL